MPGAIVKGTALPVIVSDNPSFIAETRQYIREKEFQGPQAAILGLQQQYQNGGYTCRVTNNGPVFSLYVSVNEQVVDETLDRWEVFTESAEKSLFELPDVVAASESHDDLLSEGAATFRQQCENAVNKVGTAIESIPIARTIVRHLRSGVTGWQLDLIGIRRTRRVHQSEANVSFKQNLDPGFLLYTTAQLNLPSLVAFVAPGIPADVSDLFKWRWRKRAQRTEIVGGYVEQTVELLLAPWSLTAYAESSTSLAW